MITEKSLQDQVLANIRNVVSSGIYSGYRVSKPQGGPWCQQVERRLETLFHTDHAVLCSSATAGLYMALRSIGIGFGDRVLVPANTMSATAGAVIQCGAIPIFMDCNSKTGLVTLENFVETIKFCEDEWGHLPDAAILVHIHGQAMLTSHYRAAFPHLPLIEDCAQAFGAAEPVNGFPVGTASDAGVFSFKQGKAVTCGEGGVVLTNNASVYTKLLAIRNHGEIFNENLCGFNFHMTELQAAVLAAELEMVLEPLLQTEHCSIELTEKLSRLKHFQPMKVRNAPFIFFLTSDDYKRTPKGFTRGYHKPLCCLPYFKHEVRQACCLNSHIFASSMVWCPPPKTPAEVQDIVQRVMEADRG